jgi:hypothetical protein
MAFFETPRKGSWHVSPPNGKKIPILKAFELMLGAFNGSLKTG